MAAESLAEVISTLSPAEQESVRQFIEFLRHKELPASSGFLGAVAEFIQQHPELLSRLAR